MLRCIIQLILVQVLQQRYLRSTLASISNAGENYDERLQSDGYNSAASLLIKTTEGQVQGTSNSAGVRIWKGIRYAQPPVGDLRWENPVEPNTYSDIYYATNSPPGCPQVCSLPGGSCPTYTSEDCLFLTITSPRSSDSASGQLYPVHFWIHGGSYVSGAGDVPLFNATHFALNNIVTVVINYRLGALGFMASPSMQGNYGVSDQRLALRWVQKNIAAFNGDPNSVTIAGESAGAMSVGVHLVSDKSKGLFSRAIMQSNPLGIPFHNRKTAATIADQLNAYLDCESDNVACGRSKSVDTILAAQNNAVAMSMSNFFTTILPFTPLVDDQSDLPNQPVYLFASKGLSNPLIKSLSGYNKDEGQLFVYQTFPSQLSESYYQLALSMIFKEQYSRVLAMYPFNLIANNNDGRNVLNVLVTDALFHCPLRKITAAYQSTTTNRLKAGTPDAYLYQFNHVLSFNPWGSRTYCVSVSCHAAELPFVFNIFGGQNTVSYTPSSAEKSLGMLMNRAWSNFVTYGYPSGAEGFSVSPLLFPSYSATSDPMSILDIPESATTSYGLRDQYCDMWDTIGFADLWDLPYVPPTASKPANNNNKAASSSSISITTLIIGLVVSTLLIVSCLLVIAFYFYRDKMRLCCSKGDGGVVDNETDRSLHYRSLIEQESKRSNI